MQERILAGQPLSNRQQSIDIDLDELRADQRHRAAAVLDALALDLLPQVVVLDSGIDPDFRHGDSENNLESMTDAVERVVGARPELPEPTDDPIDVIAAYEVWTEGYIAQGLSYFELLDRWGPMESRGLFLEAPDPRVLTLATGVTFTIEDQHGAKPVRDAFAAHLRAGYLGRAFDEASVQAAVEATSTSATRARALIEEHTPDEIAACHLRRVKKRMEIARAHHRARRAAAPSFETEMRRWAKEWGSDRLEMGIADGYRMNARYLAERIAGEAPGFYAMPVQQAAKHWAIRAASPTEEALRLRRRVDAAMAKSAPTTIEGKPLVEIVIGRSPPHEIYLADEGQRHYDEVLGVDLPDRRGWPWYVDEDGEIIADSPTRFEAVVVKNWLGRFHLIGAVRDGNGIAPNGIWAAPEEGDYEEDGQVTPQHPDSSRPKRAKRKPTSGSDDDIPF
jgi:hypothetical protein